MGESGTNNCGRGSMVSVAGSEFPVPQNTLKVMGTEEFINSYLR